MKKIFTLLALATITVASFAQTPKLTELWNHSTRSTATDAGGGLLLEGTPPSWMGATTERGMVTANGKIYVVSRNEGTKLLIIDSATGELSSTIMLPEGTFTEGIYPANTIGATESGDLVIANLTVNTKGADSLGVATSGSFFKAYFVDMNDAGDDTVSITNIVRWNNLGDTINPQFRLGDGFTFYGDIADGKNGYLATVGAGSNYILTWKAENGVVAAEPMIYQAANSNPAPAEGADVNFATAPQLSGVSENLLIVDGNNLFPAVYDLSSEDPTAIEMVATFSGEVTPATTNLNGVDYFEFKDRMFVVAVTNFWNTALPEVPMNSFEVFELVNGDWEQAVSLGYVPENGLSATNATKNTSFAYPASVDVQEDKAVIYVMSANMGIAAYELTLTSTGVENVATHELSIYPNPAKDILNFSKNLASVKLYDLSSRLVREEQNVSRINVSNLKGIFIVQSIDESGNTSYNKVIVR